MSENKKRSETRLDEKVTIFVEVCSDSTNKSSPENIIICSSMDISANGIQVKMDEKVPIGSVLRLLAEVPYKDQALHLIGEVKWIVEENHQFNIGFELYDAENTDIIGWKSLIANMLDN